MSERQLYQDVTVGFTVAACTTVGFKNEEIMKKNNVILHRNVLKSIKKCFNILNYEVLYLISHLNI